MTMVTALRTFPFIGKRFSWGYHNKIHAEVMDEPSSVRSSNSKWNTPSKHEYTADREGSDLTPTIWKPQTILYPYERLEDMEPWFCLLYTSDAADE